MIYIIFALALEEELSLVQNTSDLIGKVKELEERLEFEKKMKDFEREKWKETNQNLLSSVNKVKSVYESQVREREEELLIEKLQKEDLSKNCQELINLVQILQEKLNSKFQTIESMQRSQVSYFSPYSSQTQILHSERKLKSYEKNLSQLVILNERLNSIIQENNTKEEEKIKKALIGQKEIYEQEIENLLVLNEKLLKINEYNNKRQNKQIKNSLIFKEKLRIENDQVEVEKLGREKIELERIIDNLKRKLEVSEEKNAYSYLIHNFHA